MIRLNGVNKFYSPEHQVLREIDMEVMAGEFVAIVGRSGSGKTTLLNIVGGLDTRYNGEVEVSGRMLGDLGDAELSDFRNTNVGFVFQAYHLLDHLQVIENVELPALFDRRRDAPPAEAVRRRAEEVLERIGLIERAFVQPGELSGGERQRLALARALLQRPPVLLCDEPTGNLDNETGAEVISLMREIHQDDHPTVIVATHDDAIAASADRVLELSGGLLS
jgi:ABC-type lipoprotein export system ATPase subunit